MTAGLSSERFLQERRGLLGSVHLDRDTVEAEMAGHVVWQSRFWMMFFGLGLGLPTPAFNELDVE
jgi:hypothetical protein